MRIPSLREAYDAIEGHAEPRLEALARNPTVIQASAVIMAVRSTIGAQVDAVNARLLHAVNLPAGTDVQRLRRQIGELDREVRILRLELARYAEAGREDDDAGAS